MSQRFRAALPDGSVFHLLVDDVCLAFGFDPRELQLIAENRGQFFQRHIDFQDMLPRIAACLAGAVGIAFARRDLLTDFAVPLPNSAASILAVLEMWHIQLRKGNGNEVLSLAADHFAVGDVLPQILTDLPLYDLLEASDVAIDFHHHGCCSCCFITSASSHLRGQKCWPHNSARRSRFRRRSRNRESTVPSQRRSSAACPCRRLARPGSSA
jgi:hypothetical protein